MEVRFWGTRGSIPGSVTAHDIREKVKKALALAVETGLPKVEEVDTFLDGALPFSVWGTFGTNTPCVEVREGDDFVLCDAGSGLRDFGNHIIRELGSDAPREYHIFMSHFHWDHIQGFPFFIPALVKRNRINFYSCHDGLEEALTIQNSAPFFPVEFGNLEADIRFEKISPEQKYDIAGFRITTREQNHPGKSFGYRFERNGKAVVYSTDSEHKSDSEEDTAPFVAFFKDADLLIFDAQYTFADACTVKEDWGHSNNMVGVELAQRAGVRRLCLYHQDPGSSDEALEKLLTDTRKFAALLVKDGSLIVDIAYDGMLIQID